MDEQNNTIKVCIWADKEWCLFDELEDYSWKSDDYIVKSVDFNDFDEYGNLDEWLN